MQTSACMWSPTVDLRIQEWCLGEQCIIQAPKSDKQKTIWIYDLHVMCVENTFGFALILFLWKRNVLPFCVFLGIFFRQLHRAPIVKLWKFSSRCWWADSPKRSANLYAESTKGRSLVLAEELFAETCVPPLSSAETWNHLPKDSGVDSITSSIIVSKNDRKSGEVWSSKGGE